MSRPQPIQQLQRPRLIRDGIRPAGGKPANANVVSLAEHRVGVAADTHKHHEFFDS